MKGSGVMLGLALEGGGAKGAYHMGVVKAYFEEGYYFDGVVGTSIGALNGAIIAQGDFELGYELWEKMDASFLFDIEQTQIQKLLNKKIDKEVLGYLLSKTKDIIENRGLNTNNIRKTLDTMINEDKLRKSNIDFGLVTVSISDFKPLELYKEDIPYGKIVSYLIASANLPLFKIEPMEGKYYIDGGFYDNCPINLLIRKGYKEIIAVRTLGIGLHRKLEDKDIKVINIVPSEDLGMILNFDQNLIHTNLKRGYFDAMRVIKGLKGRKYYFQPVDNDVIYNSLLSIPEEIIDEIRKIMHLPQMEPKRQLFEQVIPGLAKRLGLPVTASYQDILLGILEFSAEEKGVDKLKIWDIGSFIKAIKDIDNDDIKSSKSNYSYMSKVSRLIPDLSKNVVIRDSVKELIKYLTPDQFVK